METSFLYGSFFWTLVICVILTAIDWWIGPEGRATMREKMGGWWLHVSEISYAGLVAEDAEKVLQVFYRIFGEHTFHSRFIWRVTLTSVIVTALLIVIFIPITRLFQYNMIYTYTFILYFPFNACFDVVSLSFTMYLLKKIIANVRSFYIIKLIGYDFLIGIGTAIATMFAGSFVLETLIEFGVADALEHPRARVVVPMESSLRVGTAVLITSLLPTLVHFSVGVVFLLSKLFRPVLQPIIGRVLYLFYRSKRGVLTQIAIGVGIVVNIFLEGQKFLN